MSEADALEFGNEVIFACAGLRHEPTGTVATFSIVWDGFPYNITIHSPLAGGDGLFREQAAAEERAKIVAWLLETEEIYDWSPPTIAAAIIDQEHL
jgi:hypothetical protein